MAIPLDFMGQTIQQWSDQIREDRNSQGLPPLTGEGGAIEVGQEALRQEFDSPRCVIVPGGLSEYTHRQRMPVSGMQGSDYPGQGFQAKALWTAWLGFTAHIWGDPYPTADTRPATVLPISWDFNTAIEIHRELCAALYRTCSGPTVRLDSADFNQPTNDLRRGRLLILSFAIEVIVTDSPFVRLVYGAHPDVEIDVTVKVDDHATEQPVIVIPPP